MDNKEHLRLKDFRKSLGWTQLQMVEFLNKNGCNAVPSNYSNFERGTRPVPLEYIHVLHTQLKLSYEWYFHGRGRRKVSEEKERLTVTDIGELKSKLELLTNKFESLESNMKKLYTDFYAHVAQSS